jgi:hypothetical protein
MSNYDWAVSQVCGFYLKHFHDLAESCIEVFQNRNKDLIVECCSTNLQFWKTANRLRRSREKLAELVKLDSRRASELGVP